MQSRLQSLSQLGIPTEFHSYSGLPHGFGLGTGTVAEGWIDDAVSFWQRQAGATGISSVKENAGKRGNAIYGIDGSRRDTLRRGINIVNGRKIIRR